MGIKLKTSPLFFWRLGEFLSRANNGGLGGGRRCSEFVHIFVGVGREVNQPAPKNSFVGAVGGEPHLQTPFVGAAQPPAKGGFEPPLQMVFLWAGQLI